MIDKPKCSLCDNLMTHNGVCRECILKARENWLEHYWNHETTKQPDKDCHLCGMFNK